MTGLLNQKMFALVMVVASIAVDAQFSRPSPAKVQADLDKAWQDLMSVDEQTASLALLNLNARPDAAMARIKASLRPLILDKQRAKQLVGTLGGTDEKKAQAAFEEMLYLDLRLAFGDEELREALLGPAGNRVASLICELPFDWDWPEYYHWYSPDNTVLRFSGHNHNQKDVAIGVKNIGVYGRRASWIRALRAISLLETIGTAEARTILKDMAAGHPDAAPTKAAQAALKRIKKS